MDCGGLNEGDDWFKDLKVCELSLKRVEEAMDDDEEEQRKNRIRSFK